MELCWRCSCSFRWRGIWFLPIRRGNHRVCWSSHWHWPLWTWTHSREDGDDDLELHVCTPEVGGLILTTVTNFWIAGCSLENHCELSAPGVRSFVRLCHVGSNMQFLFALAMLLFYKAWILHQKTVAFWSVPITGSELTDMQDCARKYFFRMKSERVLPTGIKCNTYQIKKWDIHRNAPYIHLWGG